MVFSHHIEYINNQVYDYDEILPEELQDTDIDNPESCYDTKLLGYPGFCQYDPRDIGDGRDVLLFQLVSESKHVSISDYGIMNFFINEHDLKTLDFSNVLYNWDCY